MLAPFVLLRPERETGDFSNCQNKIQSFPGRQPHIHQRSSATASIDFYPPDIYR
jgi:hypothetical protein